MNLMMLVPTLTGLMVAVTTFRSGLPKFAIAIAGCLLLGFVLISNDGEALGFLCFAVALVLIAYSKKLMDTYKVGPYSHDEDR